ELRTAFGRPTVAAEPLDDVPQCLAQVAAALRAQAIDDLPLQIPNDDIVLCVRGCEHIAASAGHGTDCRARKLPGPSSTAAAPLLYSPIFQLTYPKRRCELRRGSRVLW